MYRKFKSFVHPEKYGYSWDSSRSDFARTPQVNRHFRMFETYGDVGKEIDQITQHSGDWFITRDFMGDYIASLAMYLQQRPEEPGDNETLIGELAYDFTDGPSVEKIEFCASVVFKESDRDWNKHRYYSVQEKALGGKKWEHDKRFTQVQSWNDGSAKAIYAMLLPEYSNDLKRYIIAHTIKAWVDKQPKRYMTDVLEFLEWGEYHGRWDTPQEYAGSILNVSYEAIRMVIERYRKSYEFNRRITQLKSLAERINPKPAEAALQIEAPAESSAA